MRTTSTSVLLAQPANQIGDVLRHAFLDDIVVHGAQLVADSGLNLGIQAALFFCFLHVLSRAPPSVKLLYFHG